MISANDRVEPIKLTQYGIIDMMQLFAYIFFLASVLLLLKGYGCIYILVPY